MDATEYFHSMALLSLVVDWAILVARKSVLHGKVGTKTLYSLALDLVMALFGPTGHIYVTMVMHLLGQLGVEHGWLAMQGDAYVAGPRTKDLDPDEQKEYYLAISGMANHFMRCFLMYLPPPPKKGSRHLWGLLLPAPIAHNLKIELIKAVVGTGPVSPPLLARLYAEKSASPELIKCIECELSATPASSGCSSDSDGKPLISLDTTPDVTSPVN